MKNFYFILMTALLLNINYNATGQCQPFQTPCSAFIQQNKLPTISPQENMVYCWVGSAQAIFRYYGYEVDQATIVTQMFGAPIITPANAQMMVTMLNRKYIDKNGMKFTVCTPKIYDAFSWLSADPVFMSQIGATPLNNNDIRDALNSGRPIMMGTKNHAMVLTAMNYYEINGMVSPTAGWVLDPAPTTFDPKIAVGLRQLMPNEITAFFAADVIITDGW